ncbi:VIT1/CCC1 transporter family protein [Nocardia sp. NPDC088792]|uniref:VIT1/CCC1 transporter family protein n=1 Tax=Nocardia sp. NPDC088792 TaxID=3364332 RepID=UPI0037FE574A
MSIVDRLNGLRAGVLGASDGIVSTAATVIGVAAHHADRSFVAIAGLCALLAGALSMGAGEYVSVAGTRDAERQLVKAGQMQRSAMARPWPPAGASGGAFTAGASIPLLAMVCSPIRDRVTITFLAVLAALTLTGVISAHLGNTPKLRPTLRVLCAGALAMALTYLVGYVTA